ncbi:MAG: hypothetical protein TEF_14295 [Rhizobiales bacterium NRL2]|jgi:tRNA1(Val) A37 N6-methylase TrmN6|nr:MAG: hypothetical protein TEF_14295 [Rhizobiales bacterium NRL2]
MESWTDDRVLEGRIVLRQPRQGFRSGSDALLLAAACDPPDGGRALELGCGTGMPMLALGWRRPDLRVVGLERDAPTAALAAFNVRRNGLSRRLSVVCGDVGALPLVPSAFDLVLANPPYFVEGRHRRSPDAGRDRARAETTAGLAQWVAAAAAVLRPDGQCVFILRSERLAEFLAALPSGFGAEVLPLLGRPGRPAKRVLARAGAGLTGVNQLEGLSLHRADGSETALAPALFRHGAPIRWHSTLYRGATRIHRPS